MIVDPVFILEQPKHITLSVIQVFDDYPKSKEQQIVIDSLVEISDVIFMFSGKRDIDYKKFTTLHRGSGYIVCKDNSRSENLIGIVDYFRELYGKYLSYVFINDSDIMEREKFETLLKNLHDWNASTIIRPLISIKRFSEEALADMYTPIYVKSWWGGMRTVWKKGCDYQTHYSVSPFIYLKEIAMKKILNKGNLDEYLKTFVEEDPRVMIASIISDLRLKTLERYDI